MADRRINASSVVEHLLLIDEGDALVKVGEQRRALARRSIQGCEELELLLRSVPSYPLPAEDARHHHLESLAPLLPEVISL